MGNKKSKHSVATTAPTLDERSTTSTIVRSKKKQINDHSKINLVSDDKIFLKRSFTDSKERFVVQQAQLEWTFKHIGVGSTNRSSYECDQKDYLILLKNIKDAIELRTDMNEAKRFFNQAEQTNDMTYLLKAYTATGAFSKEINIALALNNDNIQFSKMESIWAVNYVQLILNCEVFKQYLFQGETYRGMRITKNDFQAYTIGSLLCNKPFQSTTKNRQVAEIFSGWSDDISSVEIACLLKYKINNKCALDLEQLSIFPDESEVLILPSSIFIIENVLKHENSNKVEVILEETSWIDLAKKMLAKAVTSDTIFPITENKTDSEKVILAEDDENADHIYPVQDQPIFKNDFTHALYGIDKTWDYKEEYEVNEIDVCWLDQNINVYERMLKKLKDLVVNLKTFETVSLFREYLSHIIHSQTCIICIVSDDNVQQLFDYTDDLERIDFIYIYCSNVEYFDQIQKNINQRQFMSISISIEETIENVRQVYENLKRHLCIINLSNGEPIGITDVENKLASLLLMHQINECFLKYEDDLLIARRDLFVACRQYFTTLEQIDTFEQTYRSENILQYYTNSMFVHHLINQSLRTKNCLAIYSLRLFIKDLSSYIQEHQFDTVQLSILTVYYAAYVRKSDYINVKQDMYISFNGFISANLEQDIAAACIQSSGNQTIVSVLFRIKIDNTNDQKKNFLSFSITETDVLINIGSVFKIVNVDSSSVPITIDLSFSNAVDYFLQRAKENMNLPLTNDLLCITYQKPCLLVMAFIEIIFHAGGCYKAVRELIKSKISHDQLNEYHKMTQLRLLSEASLRVGAYDEALLYLNQLNDEIPRPIFNLPYTVRSIPFGILLAHVFILVGLCFDRKEMYSTASKFLMQGISDNWNSSRGLIDKKLNYEALKVLEKLFRLYQRTDMVQKIKTKISDLVANTITLTDSLIDEANRLFQDGNVQNALVLQQHVLQQYIEDPIMNRSTLAFVYHRTSISCRYLLQYDLELEYLKKSFDIQKELLPSYHYILCVLYADFGKCYEHLDQLVQAKSCFEKALNIARKTSYKKDLFTANLQYQIGRIYFKQNELETCFSYFDNAVDIRNNEEPFDFDNCYSYTRHAIRVSYFLAKHNFVDCALSYYLKIFAVNIDLLLSNEHREILYSIKNVLISTDSSFINKHIIIKNEYEKYVSLGILLHYIGRLFIDKTTDYVKALTCFQYAWCLIIQINMMLTDCDELLSGRHILSKKKEYLKSVFNTINDDIFNRTIDCHPQVKLNVYNFQMDLCRLKAEDTDADFSYLLQTSFV